MKNDTNEYPVISNASNGVRELIINFLSYLLSSNLKQPFNRWRYPRGIMHKVS